MTAKSLSMGSGKLPSIKTALKMIYEVEYDHAQGTFWHYNYRQIIKAYVDVFSIRQNYISIHEVIYNDDFIPVKFKRIPVENIFTDDNELHRVLALVQQALYSPVLSHYDLEVV